MKTRLLIIVQIFINLCIFFIGVKQFLHGYPTWGGPVEYNWVSILGGATFMTYGFILMLRSSKKYWKLQ